MNGSSGTRGNEKRPSAKAIASKEANRTSARTLSI